MIIIIMILKAGKLELKILKRSEGAGEMAQCCRAWTALTEDLGSVPSTTLWLTATSDSSSRDSDPLF